MLCFASYVLCPREFLIAYRDVPRNHSRRPRQNQKRPYDGKKRSGAGRWTVTKAAEDSRTPKPRGRRRAQPVATAPKAFGRVRQSCAALTSVYWPAVGKRGRTCRSATDGPIIQRLSAFPRASHSTALFEGIPVPAGQWSLDWHWLACAGRRLFRVLLRFWPQFARHGGKR